MSMSYARINGGLYKGEWREITQEKRKGKFLFCFDTEWWETVKMETIGKEIHAKVDENDVIEAVYVNGVKYLPSDTLKENIHKE